MTPAERKIAEALRVLVDEHGTPNSFAMFEVAAYADLRPMHVGRIVAGRRIGLVREFANMQIERRVGGEYVYLDVRPR